MERGIGYETNSDVPRSARGGVCVFRRGGFSSTIENELYLITPVSKDAHDPALKAFAEWAKEMECG
jgi:hypothetical protein